LWEQTGDRAALQRDYARLSQVIADMATAYDRRDGAVLATVVSGAYSDEFIDSQLEAWLADHLAIIQSRLLELDQQPQLVAIIRRLNEAELTAVQSPVPVSAERRALVEEVLSKTGFLSRHMLWLDSQKNLLLKVHDLFTPTDRVSQGIQYGLTIPADLIVDQWGVTTLHGVSDQELQALLEYASTGHGGELMRLSSSFRTHRFRERNDTVIQALREAADVDHLEQSPEALQQLLAQSRQLLLQRSGRGARTEAHQMLLEVTRGLPSNSEAQTLLAYALLRIHPNAGAGDTQLRQEIEPDAFAEIEQVLDRAIALDGDNVRAIVLLARLRFLHYRDDEARRLRADAELLDPDFVWLRMGQADQATEDGRHDEALAIYRDLLQRPEPEVHVHLSAIRRSWVASQKANRPQAWDPLAQQFLATHPQNDYVRMRYALHLLRRGAKAEDAAREMSQLSSPDDNDPYRQQVLALIGMLRALELRDEAGHHTVESARLLQQALDISPQRQLWLISESCTARGSVEPLRPLLDTQLIPERAPDALLGCAIQLREAGQIGWLVEHGADVNRAMAYPAMLPLEYTLHQRDASTFEALLEAGANLSALDLRKRPMTALVSEIGRDSPGFLEIATRFGYEPGNNEHR
ncbi:MAG: hypothetical protein KDI56_16725, partial [Xanthomonadales bacterium]|nr:hypothetical protein [Xanthomonadales bacterium]